MKNKNKLTSNVPTSNTAITLIALIITIIVLLILAGVTLNMVMGDSGIFSKANNAKNKTEVAQYEEELRMCILELQTDSATNGTTFNMETIKNKLVEKVKELENTDDIEFPTEETDTRLEGTYKGYEFYIDDKYAAHIGDKATGIRLTTSLNPSGWTNQNVTATITIKSNNGIDKVEPDEGTKNGSNEYVITKTNITENTSFKYTVTDGQGNTQEKTAIINTIDKEPPADFTITAENTEEGLQITGTTIDSESGIDKYEYYAKKSTDGDYTKYESDPITGLASGTYSVYVIAYDKAGNAKQSNTVEVKISKTYSNITAQMVAEHPELYYGLKVTNYTSANGQNDWKIFYSDGTHIFLITGDYINTTETNRIDSNTGMTTSRYCAWWTSAPEYFQSIETETLIRFKATEYALKSVNSNNSKCVSRLLNTNNWTNYLDEEINGKRKAEKAIGSPTVEMWMDSWNARYTDSSDQIYRKASTSTSKPGYYVGTNPDPTGSYSMNLRGKEGYSNKLYYPHISSYNSCYGYWLASPSASISGFVLDVRGSGIVGDGAYNYSDLGVRPVVSLNSGITVNAEDAE